MNSYYKVTKAIRWLVATTALGFTCVTQAAELYKVTLNTSSLVGDPLGSAPYYIDFQLTSGGAPGNNSVTISDIMFNGGSAVASINLTGGASGDLTSGVHLTDTDFFNDFYQEFVPGNTLSFLVAFTDNANNPGDLPDTFSFSILDSLLGFPANIPTESFSYSLLEVNINGSVSVEAFAGIDDYQGIPAPGVTAVPEPSTYGIFAGVALAGLAFWRRRRRA